MLHAKERVNEEEEEEEFKTVLLNLSNLSLSSFHDGSRQAAILSEIAFESGWEEQTELKVRSCPWWSTAICHVFSPVSFTSC